MALSNKVNVINEIKNAAEKLKKAAKWRASGKPVKPGENFLYEMYILFSAINDLKKNYSIRYDPGTNNAFPKAPANKTGQPKFYITDKKDKKRIFQVCAGTAIKDLSGTERHPDISFQKGDATDDPTHEDCLMIWDAKFKNKADKRITHHEFSAFAHWVETLNLRGVKELPIEFNKFNNMQQNCLITNGNSSTENDAERKRVNISEVFNFFPDCDHEVAPVAHG